MNTPEIKTCPACGAVFECHKDSDCWCEQVKIHKREMMQIMQTYRDCLCPKCLKTYEKE